MEIVVEPSPDAEGYPRKRARYTGGRTACTRCKTRKQKCDDQWPSCSSCQKASADCDKASIAMVTDDTALSYIRSLEEKVACLETQLSRREQQHAHAHSATGIPQTIPGDQESETGTQPHHHHHQHHHQQEHKSSPPHSNALGEVVEALSLGNFEAPAYVGSSSGFSLALNLGSMVQASVWNEALGPGITGGSDASKPAQVVVGSPKSIASESPLGGTTTTTTTARHITIDQIMANSAGPPDDEFGRRLLETYHAQLHQRYPFLDMGGLWKLHSERLALRARSIPSLSRDERFGIFKLYMVYAIGAMLLKLTDKNIDTSPESFYMAALQHIHAARESRTVTNIEAMTLLVIYHLRSASSHGIWYMIGLAMRTAIDLGLHRRDNEKGLDARAAQKRRRLFWTVYTLERIIAVSLGRPFSIPDRQIDVDMPVDVDDNDDDDDDDEAQKEQGGPFAHAIALFKLRRIESRIQHSIYRADKPLASLRPKLESLYAELQQWRASVLAPLPGDRNYATLHYNRAVRLLVQPFLSVLPPADAYYRICLRAAGDICQAHKRLHQSLDYGHSFIAVQTVFVAGITLLYGLWTQARAVWSVALANDVRACSLVLFAMSERAAWVTKYRDGFEILVDAAMEKLQGDDDDGGGGGGEEEEEEEDGVARRRKKKKGGNLCETAAAQVHKSSASATVNGDGDEAGHGGGGDDTAPGQQQQVEPKDSSSAGTWRMVEELATWIDQESGTPVWMPAFDDLQSM